LLLASLPCSSQTAPATIDVSWNQVESVSKTTITVQDCPEPPLLRKAPTHDAIYKALRELNADYARLQPWFPYPKISVAELEAPHDGQTFWNFKLLDEVTEDFIEATKGHSVVFDLGTIPTWMFKTKSPVQHPSDPEEIDWGYEQGTELRDPSLQEVADYQARLASWYIKGGFSDEFGKWHASGHHFKVDYWEVLNEVDLEHNLSPELYTKIYDAVVEKVGKLSPEMKFIGIALANPVGRPEYFSYFLDPKHHKPEIPIDMISYHFYSQRARDLPTETLQFTIFEQADKFLTAVRYIDAIRRQYYPKTGVDIDELGSMLPDGQAPQLTEPISSFYWNVAGAMWAYVYGHLAKQGIEVVGGAEIIDYPAQFAATSLLHWENGQPNARYRVLKLLHDHFAPGDKIVSTKSGQESVFAQAFIAPNRRRKILMVNERAQPVSITVANAKGGHLESVDLTTASDPPSQTISDSDEVKLKGLAVAVLSFQ
jgi:hypothetical protein